MVLALIGNKAGPIGQLAVSLFFIISGTVLTGSFRALDTGWAKQVARRVIRLGLPMAASVSLAALWFAAWPQAHLAASALQGHDVWLTWDFNLHLKLSEYLNEIFISGMFFGHLGATLLPRWACRMLGVLDIGNCYNTVIWTLHLEFWGSMLVLALVRLQARLRPWLHGVLCGVLLAVFWLHPLGLFIIGHGVAVARARGAAWRGQVAGWVCLVGGLAVAIIQSTPGFVTRFFEAVAGYNVIPMHLNAQSAHMQFGAILVFFGVMMLPVVQSGLQSRLVQGLGRYSFSLYLVHYPVLMTMVCAIFVSLAGLGLAGLGLPVSAAVAVIAGLAVSVVLTWLFERFADAPAIRLSRLVGGRKAVMLLQQVDGRGAGGGGGDELGA